MEQYDFETAMGMLRSGHSFEEIDAALPHLTDEQVTSIIAAS